MASEVKRAHLGILKILSSSQTATFGTRRLSPLGLRRLFHYGVAARRLHQTANRGRSGLVLSEQPAAGLWPAPQKITRTARRPVKTAGSRSEERGQFKGEKRTGLVDCW